MDYNLDLIFVVDTSCGITEKQCQHQQLFISNLIQKSKSNVFPRLGYIEFDDVVDELILLNDSRYNINSTQLSTNLQELVASTENADCTESTATNTSTEIALIAAIQQFEDYSVPLGHDKKIVLISNCEANDDPCDTVIDLYNTNIDVIIVNIGDQITNITYQCLSENDPRRMFYAQDFNLTSLTTNLTEAIQREICEAPTNSPSNAPSLAPSLSPTVAPTSTTSSPSNAPSLAPTIAPSLNPSLAPTQPPSISPSLTPSLSPSLAPSYSPSLTPSMAPSIAPTHNPTQPPSLAPSYSPSLTPTNAPSYSPSIAPTGETAGPSSSPSFSPSNNPSNAPTYSPSGSPSQPPTTAPSINPSYSPSESPTKSPTSPPSSSPSQPPTIAPSGSPTQPPTSSPTSAPSNVPSSAPTQPPSNSPTSAPTPPSQSPTSAPTVPPTISPTPSPTQPTSAPSKAPTTNLNECYGSDYIFCFFMDISLKPFVTEDIVTTNAAGDDAVSFTQQVTNVPVSDTQDITYVVQWRPIDYPCYNPEISIEFKPIGHNSASAAIQVWKQNENYVIGDNLTNPITQIGQCLGDGTDCDNYENCALSENLNVPIIDTGEYYGINLTESYTANDVCNIDGDNLSMDVQVTLFCDLRPNEPNVDPEFIGSVIESIRCNETISYSSNRNGATSNYYNVVLGKFQSNITFHLCISEQDTLLTLNEWNGQYYDQTYVQEPMFDNISSFEIFDEYTICVDGYYALIIDEYVLASTNYYYIGIIVNGIVEENPYEYSLTLDCTIFNPDDDNSKQDPIDCNSYQFEFILLPLFILVIILSVFVFLWELIYYFNTTHKLFKLDIEIQASFCFIFDKSQGLQKFLYILDFLTFIGCIIFAILFFVIYPNDLETKFQGIQIFIVGGIGCMIAALLSFILLYIKWTKFLSLYFTVMNNENRINYQKQIIMFDLFSAALQDGVIICTFLIVLSKICSDKLFLHWLFTAAFVIYLLWLIFKILRTIYVCRIRKQNQHEKKQSMLVKPDDDIAAEYEIGKQSIAAVTPQESYKPNNIEMQAMTPDLDLSLTMDNPHIAYKQEEKKHLKTNDDNNNLEQSESYPINTNAGLYGEGDLMLPDGDGNGYQFADYEDDFFGLGGRNKNGNLQDEKEEKFEIRKTNQSNVRQRVVHSYYTQLCQKLMDRYGILTEKNSKSRQCELAGSGINAISAIFHGIFVEHGFNGDLNIVISNDLYYDTETLINYLQINYSSMNLNVIIIEDITDNTEIKILFQTIKDGNNILLIESCTNPFGYIFDFELIEQFKSISSSSSYIICDNTLCTSAMFNPLEYGIDIVIISLSKYYSGGTCFGGAILCNSDNSKIMNVIGNWIMVNGIHISPFYCKLILQNIEYLNKRVENVSVITRNIVFYLRDLINKQVFKDKLLQIQHPFLLSHISNDLCKKYFGNQGPNIIAIKISMTNEQNIQKWLNSSSKIKKQLSFGKKDTRFDIGLQIVNDGTWLRLSIGWNITIDDIKEELLLMFQNL